VTIAWETHPPAIVLPLEHGASRTSPDSPIRVGNQQARPPVANRWRRACSAFGCVSRLTRETREVQRPAATTLPALAVRDRSAAVV